MKRFFMIASAAMSMISASAANVVESMIAECPEKAGGIYYAYEVQKDTLPTVPDGYAPVYISHYGRHGSRWPVN
ncbi:MAG: histidine-type phosphatase, partial [Muribaculaceae bacterium]|nr:histidine-type phosphatase [Muribaculaceae bacterium]